MFWLGLGIGFLVGSIVTVIAVALCSMASVGDEHIERSE
jgi:hypothetical protein